MSGETLRVARIVPATRAEGPGLRFAVWTQGCRLRCPGCCNPELFPAEGGRAVTPGELAGELARARDELGVEGLTLVGGEPLDQLAAVTRVCEAAATLGLGVLLFTGYRLAEARRRVGFPALWTCVDTLVDGRFVADARQGPHGRRFVGSVNQRLHHRTPRYADPRLWGGAALTEVRIDADGRATVVGMPDEVHAMAAGFRAPAQRPSAAGSPPAKPASTAS